MRSWPFMLEPREQTVLLMPEFLPPGSSLVRHCGSHKQTPKPLLFRGTYVISRRFGNWHESPARWLVRLVAPSWAQWCLPERELSLQPGARGHRGSRAFVPRWLLLAS